MNSVAELLGEVAKLDANIDALMSTADLNNLESIDAALAMLERAERLLLRVEGLAGHDGASVGYLDSIRRSVLNYLNTQMELSEHRAHVVMQKAIAEARRGTLH